MYNMMKFYIITVRRPIHQTSRRECAWTDFRSFNKTQFVDSSADNGVPDGRLSVLALR